MTKKDWLIFFNLSVLLFSNLRSVESAKFYSSLEGKANKYLIDLCNIKKRCQMLNQDAQIYLDQALSWLLQDFYNDFFTPEKIEQIFCFKNEDNSWVYDFGKAFKQITFTKNFVFLIPQAQKVKKKSGVMLAYELRKKSFEQGFCELGVFFTDLASIFNSLSIQIINLYVKNKIDKNPMFLPMVLKIYLLNSFNCKLGAYNEYLLFLKDFINFDVIRLSFWLKNF